MTVKWLRVSKQNPCRICQKIDWCTFTEDGGACCMRVDKGGVTMRNGGTFFPCDKKVKFVYTKPVIQKEVKLDCYSIFKNWFKTTEASSLKAFARNIGVDSLALLTLDCVWSPPNKAWAFPMKNERSEIIGFRLRNEQGEKWAVTGSKSGLFIPNIFWKTDRLFICEGPTDTAAALTLGLFAIGRPACLGCEEMTELYIKRMKFKEVIIISDRDDAGMNGSRKLQKKIPVKSYVMTLPCKDIRLFVCAGGTREVFESILANVKNG